MMFRLLPEVMRGTHARFRQVRMGEFTQLQIQSDRALYIHMDGEIFAGWGNDVRTLRVDLLPAEVQVIS
jgi:diacylglycerol kinase family enzyme